MMQNDETSLALWQLYAANASFRFTISGYRCTLTPARQREILESFSWMDYKGPIAMKNPDLEVCIWEDWSHAQIVYDSVKHEERRGIWIGKKVIYEKLRS
jgi:hypothetical protein